MTTTTGQQCGLDEFVAHVRAACLEHPERLNPRAADRCVYRHPDGDMCLIGHVLVERLGFAYDPAWDSHTDPSGGTAYDVLGGLGFFETVCWVAGEIQELADGDNEWPPLTWGQIAEDLDSVVAAELAQADSGDRER